MRGRATFASLFCLTLLAACSLAPDYHRPTLPTPPAFKEAGDWVQAKPADEQSRGPWWQIYGDPDLNALEAKVDSANQDLKVALAQYEEARAGARVARADFFPTVTGTVSSDRERVSHAIANPAPDALFNDDVAGVDISYEIDLWGRVRNEVAAAKSLAKASAADLAGIALSVHAELAEDYFALRGYDATQAILDQTVIAYGKALEITRNRFNGGVSAELDLDQAQTQWENAKTQAAETRLKRAQLEHAIAVLTGVPPAAFKLSPRPLDAKPPALAPGLPSTLLERRPDIAAAQRRAFAANAEIGVARAAWFPTFSLSGTLGFESSGASSWIGMPSRFWTLGPSAFLPVFEGGRIRALTDMAHAKYDEAASSYRQTVLNAYLQVEDNLSALHQLQQEGESQAAATQAAERALRQEEERYEGGLVTYLDVVIQENTALQAELSSVTILTRRMTASVQLVKALGGGWNAQETDSKPAR